MKTIDEWSAEMVRNLKEAIDLMILLDDDKNMSLSDTDRFKFEKLRKNLD